LTSQRFSELSDTLFRIGVDFYRVNVDKLEEVVLEADVRVVCIFYYGIGDKVISLFQVPTYMMFKDGKKVGHATGVDGSSLHVSTSCLPSLIPHLWLEIDGVIRDELDMRDA